ncbi:MAG: phospholipase D-like domain-containing protein, partial [Acidimicrobiales bacterium]
MAVALTGCTATPATTPTTVPVTSVPVTSVPVTSVPVTSAAPSPGPTVATTAGLIIEPDQGMTPIYAALGSPSRSLDLSMYELVDTRAESILAADASRGVTVRVILDHRLEATQNQPAYSYLSAHGVQVRWAPSSFAAFHIKMFCIDRAVCSVMT